MTHIERADIFMASLGFETYRVGGSVRDEVLDRKPKDPDYVVFGETMAEVFRRLMAKKHAIEDFSVTPMIPRGNVQIGWRAAGRGIGMVEIALPRTERSTGPGHRDFEIVVDPNLSMLKDAQRRDFTFNALYRPIGEHPDEILDPLGGLDDLRRRRVAVTHFYSFRDDPLRTLRALRFVSTLGYELEAQTKLLMALHAEHVDGLTVSGHVSGTVLDEFSKLLMGDNAAEALRVARDTGVLGVAMPELAAMMGFDQGSRYHDMTTDEHTFTALETACHVGAPLRVRWALLFHDSGKPDAAWIGKDGRKHYYANAEHGKEDHEVVGERLWRAAAEEMNAPKALREDVATLIRNHMVPCEKANPVKVRRARVRLGDDMLRDLYLMRMCDLSGKGTKNAKFLANIAGMEAIRATAEGGGVPASVKDLAINGRDVARLCAVEGRSIGRILHDVLDEVVCDPTGAKLTRDWQLDAALRVA